MATNDENPEGTRSVHVVQWYDADQREQGMLMLEQDGSIVILPEDHFYAGSLTAEEADALADAIVKLRAKRPKT